MTSFKTLLITLLLMSSLAVCGGNDIEVKLWNEEMPECNGDSSDVPSMRIFFPEESKSVHRVILVLPGGLYDKINIDSEGLDWVPFFKKMGYTTAVLKYRLPHGNKKVPVADVERAMTILRANVKKWNICDDGIGMMGFAAGGHLTSYMSTHYKNEMKPDFQILMYPVVTMMDGFANNEARTNLLGDSPKKKIDRQYSCDMHVTRITPRALVMLSDDDTIVSPSNGVNYYNELYRHDVPASLYVFPTGNHGWGMDEGFDYHLEMELLLEAWLKSF